jgi:hypothetical protein
MSLQEEGEEEIKIDAEKKSKMNRQGEKETVVG